MGPWRAREWRLDPDSVDLKKCGDQGQPGTAEFRTGLRDALEQSKDVVGAQGVFSLNERDHNGTDRRAQALVKVENGKWVLVTAAK